MAKRRPNGRRGRSTGGGWVYAAGAAFALALVGAVVLLGAVSRGDDGGASAEIIVPTPRPTGVPTNGAVLGAPSASVTVTEYLDFQCPVCLRAALTVIADIEEQYVNTGQARLEIKPIAILGDESVAAAGAAQCANDEGHFWAYHDILFANQGAENDGGFSDGRLKSLAAAIGIDTATFNSCVDGNKYESQVRSNTEAAKTLGVKGTPTIFVNGQKVETSVDAISAAIDAALAGG
jgi:protein-disulfide isomerase